MKKVIGIDVSGTSVKAAEVAYSRKGVELVSFFNEKLEDGQFSEELVNVLKEKIAQGAKVVSSIPAKFAILRSAVVPFRDDRKINQIVRFEAERYLPFPAEEVVVDFYVIEPEREGKRVMLVAVRRELIEKHLSLLKGFGVKSEIIDLDSMALLNLLDEERGTFALVDVGCDTTSISIVSGGVPLLLRSIPKGADGVENEISYTISAFSLQKADSQVGKVVLSGGGAKLNNLPDILKEKLGLDVVQIDSLRGIQCNLDEENIRGCGDAAIGLALRGLKCRKTEVSVNFRKAMGEVSVGRKNLIRQVSLISIVVLLSFSLVFMRFYRRRTYLSTLERQIEKIVEGTFPGESLGKRSSLETISIFRRRVEESKERYSASGAFSTLEVLRALSLSIPSSTGVEITDMRLNENLLQLEGETSSFETVEKLRSNLSSSDYFREVRVDKADSLQGKVKFHLDIRINES